MKRGGIKKTAKHSIKEIKKMGVKKEMNKPENGGKRLALTKVENREKWMRDIKIEDGD